MHCTSLLPLFYPTPSTTTKNPLNPKTWIGLSFKASNVRKFCGKNSSLICKASTDSTTASWITDLDLYDLLGVDSSSDQAQIKKAYRKLQKRCHPDIAGLSGHEMAIILNEAYALLSDPVSRFAYDKEKSKVAQLRGYTGKPIYSVWFGAESENRAVFVDEVKCVGCLKCALFADKTFAIESVYGRARVVAQWADPEDKIQDAIQTCPVDCISMVERSNLAALEFLMSKQPRGNVRIGAGNTAGARVSNIFVDVEKFQAIFQQSKDKKTETSTNHSKEPDLQREARISAIQAIRAVSNWLYYWQLPPNGGGAKPMTSDSQNRKSLRQIAQNKSAEPDVEKLRNIATARKQARDYSREAEPRQGRRGVSTYHNDEYYWVPSALVLPHPQSSTITNKTAISSSHYNRGASSSSKSSPSNEELENSDGNILLCQRRNKHRKNPSFVPMGTGLVAAIIVQLQVVGGGGGGGGVGVKDHIGGSLAVDIVNSTWSQVILASVTWYLIGMAIAQLLQFIRSKVE